MPQLDYTLHIDTTQAKEQIEALIEDFKTLQAMQPTEELLTDVLVKRGARHSKDDNARVQAMHDHAIGLGALCHAGNCPADDGAAPAKPAAKKDAEDLIAEETVKTLALDTLVSAVQSSFWDLRTKCRDMQKPAGADSDDYWEWDNDLVPYCVAVYDGYAVARIGLTHYKVPYTVGMIGIELADQETWETVEQEWVTKNVDPELFKALRRRELGSVKALGAGRLGNYLVAWGDSERRDLYGEWFTPKTEGLKAIFDYIGKVPALYQHAMDGKVKYTPVGVIDTMEIDDVGLWTETQLDLANQYAVAVQQLARKKALGASSGTLPGARKSTSEGEITQWVIIEGSFTPTPAEPRLRELSVEEVKTIYKDMNLELPEQLVETDQGVEETRTDDDELALERERLLLLELSI